MSISTHAPLAGRDPRPRPRRGSTKISTHAPLAGRDRRGLHREEDNYYFNPRAPCGARQLGTEYRNKGQKKFQPTRPLRGATLAEDRVGHGESISTHAPLAGRDAQKKNAPTVARHFNPRAPCGARHFDRNGFLLGIEISTHAPLAGRDSPEDLQDTITNISTHAPLAGRDVGSYPQGDHPNNISTHAPLAGRDSKSVQITMHIFAITDKFQMLLHRMPPVRAFCSFLTQENHADLGANRPSDLCALVLRTIRSSVPRADTSACSRSVRFYSRTSCPSSKIEGCPFLGQ